MRFLVLLLLISAASCKEVAKDETAAAMMETPVEAPMILEVYDYKGLEPMLRTDTDKVYVVNFWATWCAPCVKELPYFETLNDKYADKNVEVLLVSLDFPKKYDSQLKPFIKEKGLKSKVVALNDTDSNYWIPKISEEWTGAIPATLIFSKDERAFYEKSFTYQELQTEVEKFLK